MRTPYLVIINKQESFLYTDKRKVKKLFSQNKDIKVYLFKIINKHNYWEDVYELKQGGKEIKIDMFKQDECTYSNLGCYIMESMAKAQWCSSIKYPSNGWHICSICGCITNEIDECEYCKEYVCWECSCEIVNNEWEEGHFCSYECYRRYQEKEYKIEYNPEEEYKMKVCNRMDYILQCFGQKELFSILMHIQGNIYEYDDEELNEVKVKYKSLTEEELIRIINYECDEDDIYNALIELYEHKTDEKLSDILDAEGFVNNLDPNDPADQWFFDD